ncbi:MAG: hypothetical protein ISR91_06260 [Candidatus Delongbacteria bacterium]|nr:hypothetical protein [Candidatus Delongbacteria bacterium]
MRKALRAPTAFALAAEEMRRNGQFNSALQRLAKGIERYDYSTVTVVSILLAAAGKERLQLLRQMYQQFPVPRYLVEQLQLNGDITREQGVELLACNRQQDRLMDDSYEMDDSRGPFPQKSQTADREEVGSAAAPPQPILTESSTKEKSNAFRVELERVLHDGATRPDPALIAILSGETVPTAGEPVLSRRLAQLLEEQGFLKEALEMYRSLPAPDEQLQLHIRLLEQKLNEA